MPRKKKDQPAPSPSRSTGGLGHFDRVAVNTSSGGDRVKPAPKTKVGSPAFGRIGRGNGVSVRTGRKKK